MLNCPPTDTERRARLIAEIEARARAIVALIVEAKRPPAPPAHFDPAAMIG